MQIRNATYTIYKNTEYELSRNSDENFVLYYRGIDCPDKSFLVVNSTNNVFKKTVSDPSEISNAYNVITYAVYKGHTFQITKVEAGLFRLSTGDKIAYEELGLEFIDRGWYETSVNKTDLEKIWEERRPSGYDLPMPKDIDPIKEINL